MVLSIATAKRMPAQSSVSEAKPAIQVSGLKKMFGASVTALDDVSFTVPERQFTSIIGPSGCGKSTLLRILAGLIPYEAGSASLNGIPITAPRQEIGVVFQTSNMLPWLSVEKNVGLGAQLAGADKRDIAKRVSTVLDTLGLKAFAGSYPHQLSGGMRQRAAIGQALVLDPTMLLMDEPFGALDALTRDRLNVELLRIWQEHMKTVVLITHSIAEAVFLSDRVLVMSERPGRIIEDLTIDLPRPRQPEQTRSNPAFGRYVNQLAKIMGVI